MNTARKLSLVVPLILAATIAGCEKHASSTEWENLQRWAKETGGKGQPTDIGVSKLLACSLHPKNPPAATPIWVAPIVYTNGKGRVFGLEIVVCGKDSPSSFTVSADGVKLAENTPAEESLAASRFYPDVSTLLKTYYMELSREKFIGLRDAVKFEVEAHVGGKITKGTLVKGKNGYYIYDCP